MSSGSFSYAWVHTDPLGLMVENFSRLDLAEKYPFCRWKSKRKGRKVAELSYTRLECNAESKCRVLLFLACFVSDPL